MSDIILPGQKETDAVADQESFGSRLDVSSVNQDENKHNNEEKKETMDTNFEKAEEDKMNVEHFKVIDLETQVGKNIFQPGYSKSPRRRGRFTSTWVQYFGSDDFGYAYGGADPLNYDPTTKNRFVRGVFTIVLMLLIITSIFNFCSAKMDLGSFFGENSSIFILVPVAVVTVSLNFFMALSECTRSPPFIYICLFLTLIGTCVISGFFSGRYNALLIMYVYVTTAFVVIALLIIAYTSYDFTHWSLYIIAVCVALPFLSGFFSIAYNKTIEHERPAYPIHVLVIMLVGTVINVLTMTIMLQIILVSQAVEILEDDYTLGAFYIYTSIFDIYIKIIQLLINITVEDEE